ncbi:MAG TPA: heme o synthase [Bryobacteraceae bacterium]|nr:heme o synthase [Bryobacteraceae bacterium]
MRDYLELTKPRITLLILICAAVGYWFGCGSSFHWTTLANALLGTAFLASGTAALNQWYEVDSDAKMRRTRRRPLPAGRIPRANGLVFGLLLSAAGFGDLWYGTNLLAAALGLFTLLSYLLLYTPLKQRSPACTTVGAIPGAMPPVIGYVAAGHGIHAGAIALFLILFIWQFPHFDAIAWMYRDDYARGGIRMLPVIDPDGQSTMRRVLVCSGLLIPISLVPRFLGMTGGWYATVAILAGIGIFYFSARMGRKRNLASAHALLLATVLCLPALLGVMVIDRKTPGSLSMRRNTTLAHTSQHP